MDQREITTFAELRKTAEVAPLGVCMRCRKGPTKGSVFIGVRERKPGRGSGDKTIASSSKALCERCTVQVYKEMSALFNDLIANR